MKVLQFTGNTKGGVPVTNVIDGLKNSDDIEDLLVIAVHKDDFVSYATANMTIQEIFFRVEQLKYRFLSGEFGTLTGLEPSRETE